MAGQLWQLIASIGTPKDLNRLIGAFRKRSKKRDRTALEMGLIAFAAASTRAGLLSRSALARRINLSNSYLQSIVIPFLAENEYSRQGLIGMLLQKPHAEPGLVIVPRLVVRNLSHHSFGIQPEKLAPQVRNALEGVGLLPAARLQKFDQVGDILKARFKIAYWGKWRNVLGTEYSHCLSMLLSANAKYDSDRSEWLAWQDSFNDALFKAMQVHLSRLSLKGACSLIDSRGALIDYGSLLDPNKPFATAYPVISLAFRKAHVRRNSLPTSHPYEKKTAKRTTYLKKKEQRQLLQELATAYLDVAKLLDTHL